MKQKPDKALLLFSFFLFFSPQLYSEGLFDSALNESAAADTEKSEKKENDILTFNGSLKGQLSSTINRDDGRYILDRSYTEFKGKIKTDISSGIKGFSEVRLKSSADNSEAEPDLREAYIDIYTDSLDISFGKKIIVWGKADAVNPTNRLTPIDMSAVSPDEDEKRLGNLLAEGKFDLYPFTFTAIYIPVYRATVTPPFIPAVTKEPDPVAENSAFAVKLDFESGSYDFSLSYFNGYNPIPGISGIEGSFLVMKPYRIHNYGIDFSTTVSDYGVRGEAGFLYPYKDPDLQGIPSAELSYIAGIDRSIEDFTVIFQYYGKYIPDFKKTDELDIASAAGTEIENRNRALSSQTDEITHSLVFRPELKLLHETLSLETAGIYNFTTEELLLRPLARWDAADSLQLSAGSIFYSGPDGTLSGMAEKYGSCFFTELKLSF